MAEAGDQTPRTLAAAFLAPIGGSNPMDASVAELRKLRDAMDVAYGACADRRIEMQVGGAGTLGKIVAFCQAV